MSTGVRTWVVAAWLVVFSNGALFFVARRFLDLPGTWEGPVLRPAILLATAVGVGLVVLDSQRLSGERLRSVPAVPLLFAAAFGVWATLTTFWSIEPEITLWRGLVYVFLPFVAWVIADLHADAFRRALALGAGGIVIVSLAVIALRPRWGRDFNLDWRGLMTNRNGFAPICAIALIAGVAYFVDGRRWIGALLSGTALVGLAGSGSRTAWLALAAALIVGTLVIEGRRRYLETGARWIVPTASAGTLAAVVVGGIGVSVLWNESTFVQRRTIWELVGDRIGDAPIVGNGWEAFWHVPELHTEELLRRGSAHGSIPDLLLGTGVVGLGLWLVVVGYATVGVVRAAWHRPGIETWMWLSLVVLLLVENLTESFVMWFSYNWILLIAAALRFPAHRSGREVTTADLDLVGAR